MPGAPMLCEGWASRLALGVQWLGALGVAGAGRGLLPALPLAAVVAALGGLCARELRILDTTTSGSSGVSNRRGPCRFIRTWLALLSRLAALAGGARALGGALDALGGARARHWLFGERLPAAEPPLPPDAEPWPDPMAVGALALLCLMFMCGLDNTVTLTCILTTSVLTGVISFTVIGSLGANLDIWKEQSFMPNGWNGMILLAASCTYAFPAMWPATGSAGRRAIAAVLVVLPFICMTAITVVFSMISPYREYSESTAPLIQVFESHEPHWARPATASFAVVGLALAITEVLPQAVALLTVMASPEWKVLTKILAYESATTGSQVLAVFSVGSLSAILAFACPMAHLVKLTCAGQVLVWIFEAGTLLHLRCQPEDQIDDPSDVRYKRLAGAQAARPGPSKQSRGARLAAGLWFLPRSVRQAGMLPDAQKTRKGDAGDERECLLLDEYAAAKPGVAESDHSEHSEISDHLEQSSSDGESSTDIDAVVKEYKDTITVVSSIPEAGGGGPGAVPTTSSGKRATVGAVIITTFNFMIGIGTALSQPVLVFISIPVVVGGALLCWWQPVRTPTIGVFLCTSCSMLCTLVATPLLADAWPALVLFTLAGLVMYTRRSTICGGPGIGGRGRSGAPPLLGPRPARISHLDTVYISR